MFCWRKLCLIVCCRHGGFNADVFDVHLEIVTATIALYNAVCSGLLPTPTKPHYTFNLRDVGKVFQVCSA